VNRRELMSLIGGAAALGWPLVTRAQQRIPVIGWLSAGSAESDNIPARLIAFRRGLSDAGYVEGENVAIEYRWAESQYNRAPDLVADLVRRQVSVIFAVGGAPMAFAAKAATMTIPIIFNLGDPVQLGLVASLNRPSGNVTGVASLAPSWRESASTCCTNWCLRQLSWRCWSIRPTPLTGSSRRAACVMSQIPSGCSCMSCRRAPPTRSTSPSRPLPNSVPVRWSSASTPFFTSQRKQIVALAARHAVPAIYGWREYPTEGGLMSYGPNLADSYRLAAVYVAKILKGTSPADLPVEQSVKIELVINLKTAKTLGLTIPLTIIGRADEVIE